MFGFHVTSNAAKSVAEAVQYGFLAWGLLALSMGIICLVVVVLNKLTNKKKEDK